MRYCQYPSTTAAARTDLYRWVWSAIPANAGGMADQHEVDRHLVAVLNEVLDAVYQAKQASWSSSTSPDRADLEDLVSFLIDQSGRLMVAEERIEGRSADVAAPSSHQRGNLLAEAKGDLAAAVSMLVKRLQTIADDARSRATAIPDAVETEMLTDLADGLNARTERLQSR